jgi:two-component system, OmpR family, phosphate regulon sensor histidine kinase PhoR
MGKARILVIDDEYGVRSGIRQILEMEGYDVEEAETGRGALELLDRAGFDVVLIDYQLPDLDGLTLLQAMRARKVDAMTCMITAYANIDTAIAATRQGVDFFLPKPFLPDDLLGVIDTLLRHRRLTQESDRLRRENEANLLALASEKTQTHSLVTCLRDAVLVVNRDLEVVLVNPAMAAILKTDQAAVLRQPIGQVLAGAAFAPLLDLLGGSNQARMAFEIELGDRGYMATLAAFQTDDGQALGRILTLSDISEVRRMAMERSRFIRTMVHELKSPLGAIRSMIEVVHDKSLGDSVDAYLPFVSRAEQRIDNLVEMISTLLSLSKIDLERQVKPAEPIEVGLAIDDVVASLQEPMKAKGIKLSVELPSAAPRLAIRGEDLRTVLVNLVGNAIKYNRERGEIAIKASARAAELTIEIRDTGLGVKPENVPHLFDEFFREKRAETRGIEGNGLGLAIVKRLVDRAGGRIEVASTESKGTTFLLVFPV